MCIHLKVVSDLAYSWQPGIVICKSRFLMLFQTWVVTVAMHEQEEEKGASCGMEFVFSFSQITA